MSTNRQTAAKPEVLTVSVEHAALHLGIGRSLAYELVRRGELPSIALGGRRVVPKAALRRMMDDAVIKVLGPERTLESDVEELDDEVPVP